MDDRCVCCGVVVPEGRQVCQKCESKVNVIRCKDCDHGSHVGTPEGRVWCEKICRYMRYEGYCSLGERKDNGKQT